ncbi:MAG: UDP-N-acetylglucosamine 1-carboxyvinyltransferase, partial [Alicyclobacillus shizuokensis]|nr:UDP-N-acetylglucosamine 1-carboxyvinyltransferase [Alicyclobacillus shizuokensis]
MSKMMIEGGHRLRGRVRVSGAKNAVLPILAASLLAESGTSQIEDVPDLLDVRHMMETIQSLGAIVDRRGNTVRINAARVDSCEPPAD